MFFYNHSFKSCNHKIELSKECVIDYRFIGNVILIHFLNFCFKSIFLLGEGNSIFFARAGPTLIFRK